MAFILEKDRSTKEGWVGTEERKVFNLRVLSLGERYQSKSVYKHYFGRCSSEPQKQSPEVFYKKGCS